VVWGVSGGLWGCGGEGVSGGEVVGGVDVQGVGGGRG